MRLDLEKEKAFDEQLEKTILHSRQGNKLGESSQHNTKMEIQKKSEGKYTCSYCKGIGHNARSCRHKKCTR